MKRIFTLILCISMFYQGFGQLQDGTIAPDFTVTDINGNVHNLYSYLEAGKTVFLDFSATWCGPCWNYHNTHALRTIYDTYGPNGTNEAWVIFIEGDASTALECLYGNCSGTQGNWVAGTTYPIANDHNWNSAYNIGYYPTIYGICPNYKVTEVGQLSASGLQAFMESCSVLSYVDQIVDTNCYGEETGTISLSVNTGILPYTYSWSNGSTSESISGLAPGTYYCTITAGDGSTLITEGLVVEGPTEPLSSAISEVNSENCSGNNGSASVIAIGAVPPYNYQWSNGASAISAIFDVPAGIYTVTITDGNGCGSVTETIEIGYVPPPVSEIAEAQNLNCNNFSTTLDGTASTTGPQYTYEWNTFDGIFFSGQNTLNPQIGSAGTYTLVVTDIQYGCSSETFVTIESNFDEPEITIPQANPIIPCGSTNVQLQAQVDENLNNIAIHWTTQNGVIQNGATTLTPNVSQVGTYTIRVENLETGCYAEQSVTVTQAAEFVVAGNAQAEKCADQNNGSINVQVTGGAGPFNYTWNEAGVTGHNPTNLAPGQYTVSVSDNFGCQTVSTYTILEATAIESNSTVQNESNAGAADGSIDLVVTGGTSPYTYLWSNGATTAQLTNLSAGVYQVVITDANGCKSTKNIAVSNAGCAITAAATVVNTKCSDSADGSVTITVQNGGAEVEAIWPDGETGLTRDNLSAGTYSVIIEDESGCPLTILVEVKAPDAIEATPIEIPEFACASASDDFATLSIDAAGGTGNLEIVWNDGQTGSEILVTYGTYTAVLTDDSGCSATYTVTTKSADKEAPQVSTEEIVVLYLDEDGHAYLAPSDAIASYSDNCEEVVLEAQPSIFNCSAIGETETTITASDLSGNSTVVTVPVKVIDNLAPAIVCPDNIITTTSRRVVDYEMPEVTENCNVFTLDLVSGLLPGSSFPNGVTQNVFIATDASGNSAVCNFTVMVGRVGGGVVIDPDRNSGIEEGFINPRNGNGLDKAFAFQAWPNPVDKSLYVSLQNMYDGATVSLVHISGKVMLQNEVTTSVDQTMEIPVDQLMSGMYFLHIIENGMAYKQLIQIK